MKNEQRKGVRGRPMGPWFCFQVRLLPGERAQLQALARAKNLSLGRTIGELITSAREGEAIANTTAAR